MAAILGINYLLCHIDIGGEYSIIPGDVAQLENIGDKNLRMNASLPAAYSSPVTLVGAWRQLGTDQDNGLDDSIGAKYQHQQY